LRLLPAITAALSVAVIILAIRPVPSQLAVSAVAAAEPDLRQESAHSPGLLPPTHLPPGRQTPESLNTPRESGDQPIREPAESPIVVPASPTLDAPRASLSVLVLESGSRRPLPDVGVEALTYRAYDLTRLELAIDGNGLAFIDAGELREVDRLLFEIHDPELGSGHYVRPGRSVDQLLRSPSPFEILVPRGTMRDFLVVGSYGAPIGGATLEGEYLRPAVTGANGQGRVRMTAPPVRNVQVWAPGYRVEYVPVPQAEQPWTIQLQRANRLEFALLGAGDVRGYHLQVRLPKTMQQRTFYQSHYVQTPGRPRAETPAHWSSKGHRGPSEWTLGFNPAGLAILDQIYDSGTIEVELLHFHETLDARSIILPDEARTLCIEFDVSSIRKESTRKELTGRVVDREGRPLPDASVRMAPFGGRATIELGSFPGFPIWAPDTKTNAEGEFRLPAPRSRDTVVVFSGKGFAHRALTITEIEALDDRIELEPGHAVLVEVRDRNGEPIDGGWSSGWQILHARPSAHIGHDVWLDVSSHGHPDPEFREKGHPYFSFESLPTGVVKIRFMYLPRDEFLLHDTRIPFVRMVSRRAVDELGIGK